jgi:hypothetical protein
MKKQCGMCGKKKELTEFYRRSDRMTVAGLGSVKARCKVCSIKVSTEWQRNNRAEAAAHAKRYRERLKRGQVQYGQK